MLKKRKQQEFHITAHFLTVYFTVVNHAAQWNNIRGFTFIFIFGFTVALNEKKKTRGTDKKLRAQLI